MSELNEGLIPVINDARALAEAILGGNTLDGVLHEYQFPPEHIGQVLFGHARAYYGANSEAAISSILDGVCALEPTTDYGKASVAAVKSGARSYDFARDVFIGSNRVACEQTEPNFVRASESQERLGLVFVQDGVVVAAQKKTGQENTVLALEDLFLASELNGQVFVPKSAVFSVGKSAVDGDMKVVDVGVFKTHKAVVLRATTFSLPEGVVETSKNAPWFNLPKDERGLGEIQRRVQSFIS